MDSELEGIESRQRGLERGYESVNAQATSVMKFAFQWKELDEHIESTKEVIKSRLEEVKKREEAVAVKEKEAEVERDVKAMELHRMQRMLEEKKKVVDETEKRFKEVEELVREKEVDLSLNRKCNEEARKKSERLEEEIRGKLVQLKYVQGLVEKQWKEYDEKEGKIQEMVRKESDFMLLQRSMEERGWRLEEKETGLRRWVEKLEEQEKEIDAKVTEVNLMDKKVHKCLEEVKLKEQQLISLEESLHVQSCGLQKKERELEIKRERLDSDMVKQSVGTCTQNLKSNENYHPMKDDEFEDATAAAYNGNMNGRGLQLIIYQHLMRSNFMLKEIEDTLQRSPNPAKVILDAMDGFYPSCSAVDNKSDLTAVRRTCILLLEELMRVSPEITPQLREETMNFAADWKAKMNTDNWLEVLGLLLLIAAYDLSSNYNVKELESLVRKIARSKYDTSDLCLALGLGAKAPDQDTPSQSTSESNLSSIKSSMEKPADSPVANIQRTTTIDTHVTNSQVLPNEHLRTAYQPMIPVVTDGSCQSLASLASTVYGAGIIQDLIANRKPLEAIALICNLKLTDKFPPVPLLRECAECAIRNSSETVDDQISVLKGVIKCIKDYNLESEYPSKDIELQLHNLECRKVATSKAAARKEAKPPSKNSKKKRSRSGEPLQQGKKLYKCYFCNEQGHFHKNCPRKC